MAHTKSAGAGKYGRDSRPKYLGIKKFDGERIRSGGIIVRQRGTKFFPGEGVKRGGDDTLFSLREGIVKFGIKRKIGFDRSQKKVNVVKVIASSKG